jgi:hypothetical protein
VLGGEDAGAAAVQERAELQQVRAVRLERVARQAPLELEVGEEVEHVMLERSRLGSGDDGHGAGFAVAASLPRRCNAACAVHAALRRVRRRPGACYARRAPISSRRTSRSPSG